MTKIRKRKYDRNRKIEIRKRASSRERERERERERDKEPCRARENVRCIALIHMGTILFLFIPPCKRMIQLLWLKHKGTLMMINNCGHV